MIILINNKKQISCIYIVVAAILWGMISVFNRMLTSCGLNQLEIVFLRSVVALVGTVVYVAIKDKTLFKIKFRDIWCFVGSGIFSLLFFNVCYFNAMQENISVAAVLLYTAPAFVMIMSAILFKESLTFKKLIALVVMLFGCVLVTGITAGTNVTATCVFFGIGSGVGYALYSIFSRFALNKGYKSETITLYTFLLATIGNLPMVNYKNIIASFNISAIVGAIGIGIVCCLLPYIFYTKGLEGVTNGQASVIATVEPVVATFISIMYGDAFGWNNAFGIFLVLLSIIIINIDDK